MSLTSWINNKRRILGSQMRGIFAARVAILLYHRIAEPDCDPWGLCVGPERFEQHVRWLQAKHRVISLRDLNSRLNGGTIQDGSVVVTFDDGYKDNVIAKAILERFEVSATVFITTDAIGSEYDFWWDQLSTLLLWPLEIPDTLELEVGACKVHWRQHRSFLIERELKGRLERKSMDGYFVDRTQLYHSIYDELRFLDAAARFDVLRRIARWSSAPSSWIRRVPTLTEREVCELADGGLIEIGAHTVSHPVLSEISLKEQRAEISCSRNRLTELLHRPIVSFAYPHGARRDFTRDTVKAVEDAGFECACAAEPGTVWSSTDRYALPRITVGDWSAPVLEKALRPWLG